MLQYCLSCFRHIRFLLTVCSLLLFCACAPPASSIHANIEGYDLDHPVRVNLPTVLNEISGLWYYPKDKSLFAIIDETGYLYKVNPRKPDSIFRWKFAGYGDFEDLVLVGNTFFILESNGTIYATSIPNNENIQTVKYSPPEKGNEYESLYYDETAGMLILICKDCKQDSKKSLSTLGFNVTTRQFVPAPFIMNASDIAGIVGEDKIKFKPSAATLNPFNGQLMMISAINGLLVTASRTGEIIQAYPLNKKLYKQPEGIAIGADRTLYISNEWNKKGAANIMILPYRPQKK